MQQPMNIDTGKMLHPRITKHCSELLEGGHYKHAALEAMTQVELALKDASPVPTKLYGTRLTDMLLGPGKRIKLAVPFAGELQEQAAELFRGAFGYYRNYAAHDGSQFSQQTALRVLVLASELLDLIGASSVRFADVGGVPGLIAAGVFPDEEELRTLLDYLPHYTVLDNEAGALFEALWERGFTENQMHSLLELGLIEYHSKEYEPSQAELDASGDEFAPPDEIGWFELTPLGTRILDPQRNQQP